MQCVWPIFNSLFIAILTGVSHFSWHKFLYFTENLYKAKTREYILETKWQLSPVYHKDNIANGTITEDELLPKTEYRLMSFLEADTWLENAVWEV